MIAAEPPPAERGALASRLPRVRQAYGVGLVALGVPLLTAVLLPVRGTLGLDTVLLSYLLVLVAASAVGGWVPALLAAAGSSMCANYFFTPPYRTLLVANRSELIDLVVFFAVAVLVAFGAEAGARSRAHAERSRLVADWVAQLGLREPASVENALKEARLVLGASAVELTDGGVPVATQGSPAPGDDTIQTGAGGELTLVVHRPPVLGADAQTLPLLAGTVGRLYRTTQLEAQARRAEELARVDDVRSALLAAVGHDLRNPLAAIKTSVSTLRDLGPHLDDHDRTTLLEGIETDTDRLTELVENLLDMSRIRAGALSVHLQPTALGEVVRRSLRPSSNEVFLDLPDDLPLVVADAGLLERVIANLVDNAQRHAGGSRIDVRAEVEEDRVLVQVVDHGPGIPTASLTAAFTPFQRFDDRSHGGVGLGLAIARGLTEAMGGHLTPSTTPGGGLTMTIDLEVDHGSGADR